MSLHTVQEIERAIRELSPQELEELYSWLDQYQPQLIDARLRPILPQAVSTKPSSALWKNRAATKGSGS